jgi:acetone carboxylase gamma subunit
MGIYVYTLRAETRIVDGVEIGHYGYAYKSGWDWHADSTVGSIKRRIRALFAKAENAAHKNRDVRHFIAHHFAKITEPTPVFATAKVHDVIEEEIPGVIVGYLRRDGRKLRFIPETLK